ncbi:unnamed protein product [Rotaria magnacalcarata]|uniref:Uncharacterized protein n=2 Tax=Rotaria magnacalcarata TaxID=392030 RepID=A0A816VM25_9BILA|nr:unnamed protein product [Rotaria magnacalcarata]
MLHKIELSQERLPTRTDVIDQSNSERLYEENRTPVINRSIAGKSSSVSRTPLSADRIVVSVDRRQRELNEDLNRNHASNTPIRPFRHNQIRNTRPAAAALNYLVDLVTQIQHSSGRDDPTSAEQLARDLGEDPKLLMGFKDVTPQQSALNLFNHLYPRYESKVELDSISKLEDEDPDLLRTILSAILKNESLKCNSILGARFHWRKLQLSVIHQTDLPANSARNQPEIQEEHHHNPNRESSNNVDTRHEKENEDFDAEI